jgi:hypothetical protein
LRTDTLPQRLEIALEARDDAERLREVAITADDGESFAEAIEAEFRAPMIALTSSAFALDAFYGSVIHHAPDTRVKASPRSAKLKETFKHAFTLSADQEQAIDEPLRQIFDFRGTAVHPREEYAEPVVHPVFGLGMEQPLVIFSYENARLSYDFAHRLIWLCLHRPKARWPDLVKWCDETKERVRRPDDLEAPGTQSTGALAGPFVP